MSAGTYRDDLAEIQTFILLAEAEELIRQGEEEYRAYKDLEEARAFIDLAEIREWIADREYEEKRYNHNHDSMGRFASSNSGLTGGGGNGRINHAVNIIDEDHELYSGTVNAEQLKNELNKTEIGRHALQYLDNSDVVVKLDYEKPAHFDRGQQDGNLITLFMANIGGNPLVAAQTVVHEVCHHEYGIGGSQWAEAVCFCHEKMLKENRTWLTFNEKRKMVELAKKAYPNLKWR